MENKFDLLQHELLETKKENKVIKEILKAAEKKIENQEERINLLEKGMRKRNVVVHGLTEHEDEIERVLGEKPKELFKKIEVQADITTEIQQINGLGEK